MSDDKFEAALKVVLAHEGGYSNIPEDHGGPTNYGITQHDLAVHRGHPVSADDVRHMTVAEAGDIYRKVYWTPYRLDEIQSGSICTIVFDMGVLNGPGRAVRFLQAAAGCMADGVVGPKTLAAVNAEDPKALGNKILDMCDAHFRSIVNANPSQSKFLRGWLNRDQSLRKLVS